MDIYWSKLPKAFTLIKIIFTILTSIIATGILMIFILKINESVPFKSGEIISRNAPVEYKTQYEANINEIRIKEGDPVSVGDTLMILSNEILLEDYHSAKEGYWLSLANINLFKKQLKNLEAKDSELKSKAKIAESRLYDELKIRGIELSATEKQVNALKENIEISKEQLKKDQKLLEYGAISDLELKNNYQIHLDKLNELTTLQKQNALFENSEKGLKNRYSDEIKQSNMQILANDYEYINLKKTLLQEEVFNQEFANKLDYTSNELSKLVIVSELDGFVSKLINTKKISNYIAKGASLVTIRPKEGESYYAKISIPQESVSKLDTGQIVHLHLEAYNFYQYGILKGKIAYISQQDTSSSFYLLADITSDNSAISIKNGYKVKGDIILEEIRLSRFILNRLFHKIGS
jgi:multidrug resistance efflux pump